MLAKELKLYLPESPLQLPFGQVDLHPLKDGIIPKFPCESEQVGSGTPSPSQSFTVYLDPVWTHQPSGLEQTLKAK